MVQQRRFDEIYDDLVDVWKKMEADTLAFKNLLDELCKANYANNWRCYIDNAWFIR